MDPELDGLAVSADFVDRVVDSVLADRAQIAADAARVDEIVLPRTLLDRYEVPLGSAGFVDRTVESVIAAGASAADHDERELVGSDDPESDAAAEPSESEVAWRSALSSYPAPPISDDFIERTLSALQLARVTVPATKFAGADTARSPRRRSAGATKHGSHPQPSRAPRPTRRSRRAIGWFATAATLLLAVVVWRSMASPLGDGDRSRDPNRQHFVAELSAGSFTPTRWSSELAASAPRPGIRFQPVPAFFAADVVLANHSDQVGGRR